MDATKARLGRGLDALLGDAKGTPAAVPTALIKPNPYQPRKRFDDDELKQLTASVKQHGILQPLVVRQVADGFQLIAGERRLRAAQAAGLADVPVHVVRFDEQQSVAVVHLLPGQHGLPVTLHGRQVFELVSQATDGSPQRLPVQQGSPAPPHLRH